MENLNYSAISSENSQDCFAEYEVNGGSWSWATGDCSWELYGGTWVFSTAIVIESGDEDEPDSTFYLVKKLHNETEDEDEPKYLATLHLVSLDTLSQDKLEDIASCYDWDSYDYGAIPLEYKLSDVTDYGCACHVWDMHDVDPNGYQCLFELIDEEVVEVMNNPEKYLEMPQNALGHTGWHRVMGVW